MKSATWCLIVLFASISVGLCEDGQLRVAAFNVQIFGVSKFSQPEVVSILSRIVRRYDVVLIQEIRDVSETVITSFLDIVNNDSLVDGVQYSLSVSVRLGRTSSKEQYAFMYRMDKVTIVSAHQYMDTTDLFERPPYSILLNAPGLPQFFLTGVHIQPSSAFNEINSLLPVYEVVSNIFNTSRGIILGDMNADCSWLSQTSYSMLDLVNDGRFHWLIDSQTDTTTNSNDCSYDRIVVSGGVLDYVVNGSAGVFRYDDQYNLTMELALDVSDHYPVHFTLQGEGSTGGGRQVMVAALVPLLAALCALALIIV